MLLYPTQSFNAYIFRAGDSSKDDTADSTTTATDGSILKGDELLYLVSVVLALVVHTSGDQCASYDRINKVVFVLSVL